VYVPDGVHLVNNVKQPLLKTLIDVTSGDIDLLGMFPIHKTGAKVGTCGSLSLDVGTEYLTESFLYAVNTAKSRYPYLLPMPLDPEQYLYLYIVSSQALKQA
jgi:hypothetical protein